MTARDTKMMLTDWVEFEDEHGSECRLRAQYGLQRIAGQEPYVSVTGASQYRDHQGHWCEGESGCIHELIERHIPALKPLLRWHLCFVGRGPMHYLANAVYFAENGAEDEFKSTVVFGAVEGDELPVLEPFCCEAEGGFQRRIRRWCEDRLPALLAAMKEDLQLCERSVVGGKRRAETSLLEDLCEQHGIVAESIPVTDRDLPAGLDPGSTSWTVRLTRYESGAKFTKDEQPLQLVSPFFMGSAHTEPPTAEAELRSLLLDAEVAEFDGFEDWAECFGYDSDSRAAARTYRECCESVPRLRAFLGELFEEFRAAAR